MSIPTGITKYSAIPCDNVGRYIMKEDRAAIIGPLDAAVVVSAPSAPAPHDKAGIATETRGSNVQSNTHRNEAMLDTSTKRSFHDETSSSEVDVGALLLYSSSIGLLLV